MRIFVTGATGVLGRRVLATLVEKHHEVVQVDASNTLTPVMNDSFPVSGRFSSSQ